MVTNLNSKKIENFQNVEKKSDVGEKFSIEKGPKIGSGGFSNVYKVSIVPVSEEKNKNVISGALKYVSSSQNTGIESLMEAYIMKYLLHPHINRAWNIQLEKNGSMRIVQPIAIGDAASIVRKKQNRPKPETLVRWFFQIVSAVSQLHVRGILHGDIKGGNVLIFNDEKNVHGVPISSFLDNTNVKLNDFSLSRLIIDPERGTKDVSRHISYTSTHRPIEVWKSNPYSFPADIWALGCTFYELAYGMILFPDQSAVPRSFEVEANVMMFEDWAAKESTDLIHPVKKPNPCLFNSNFQKYNLSQEWDNEENCLLNDLIIGMLNVDPNSRLNIWEIINHDYFSEIRCKPEFQSLLPNVEERHFPTILYPFDGVSDSLIQEINRLTDDPNIVQLSVSIFQRLSSIASTIKQPSIRGCIIVASKLLYRAPPPNFGVITHAYLQEEINICLLLNYKLISQI